MLSQKKKKKKNNIFVFYLFKLMQHKKIGITIVQKDIKYYLSRYNIPRASRRILYL